MYDIATKLTKVETKATKGYVQLSTSCAYDRTTFNSPQCVVYRCERSSVAPCHAWLPKGLPERLPVIEEPEAAK